MSKRTTSAALAGFFSGAADYVARKWESERAEAAQAKRDERLAAIQREATQQSQAFQAEQGALSRTHASGEAQLTREQQVQLATQQQEFTAGQTDKQLAAQMRIASLNEGGQNARHAQSMETQRAGLAAAADKGTVYTDQNNKTYRIPNTAEGDATRDQLNASGVQLRLMSQYPDRYDPVEPAPNAFAPGSRPGAAKVEQLTRGPDGRLIIQPRK